WITLAASASGGCLPSIGSSSGLEVRKRRRPGISRHHGPAQCNRRSEVRSRPPHERRMLHLLAGGDGRSRKEFFATAWPRKVPAQHAPRSLLRYRQRLALSLTHPCAEDQAC